MINVFDIEVYQNYFSVLFQEYPTKTKQLFKISLLYTKEDNKKNLTDLVNFINNKSLVLVGYNNHHYDNQILNYLFIKYKGINLDYINEQIYRLSSNIIHKDLKNFKYNLPFIEIDLKKINYLNKSLKSIAINLKHNKIQDLPYSPDRILTLEEAKVLDEYLENDVEMTYKLTEFSAPRIKLRTELTFSENINVLNESNSGIANRWLEKIYSESTGQSIESFKESRTLRNKLIFKDIIQKDVYFKTPYFKEFLHKLTDLVLDFNIEDNKVINEEKAKFSLLFDNVEYSFGLGGLHSCDTPDVFSASNEMILEDADVASFYPSFWINKQLYPAHLNNIFIKRYKDIRSERFSDKKEGRISSSNGKKIVLNAAFGKTKSKNHWLYDINVAFGITLNCQLYILMLVEDLVLNGIKVISANTDGVVSYYNKSKKDLYKEICARWCSDLNFELEFVEYSKYIRRDINNYLAIKPDGKYKAKGDYDYISYREKYGEVDFSGSFNSPVVSYAVFKYFKDNIPVEETIKNHKDIYDFCLSQNIDEDKFDVFYKNQKEEVRLQKTNRFFICERNGGSIYKKNINTNEATSLASGEIVKIFNDFYEADDYEIKYSYYISQANKLIRPLITKQLTIFDI